MNKFTPLLSCILYILYTVEAASINYATTKEWKSFKTKFLKSYNSKNEEEIRSNVFMENKRLIDRHNEKFRKGEVTFEMGLNEFSDLSDKEFAKMMKLDVPKSMKHLKDKNNGTALYKAPTGYKAPPSIDWIKKGAVTGVRHQGIMCGSCWAFATVGALEGQYFRKNGRLVSLSEQNLVDCASAYGTTGCDGGWPADALNYVKDRGIATSDSYPYKGVVGKCRHDRENTSGFKIKGYYQIQSGNEEELKKAVATIGPITIVMDFVRHSFEAYKQGIYYEPNCSSTKELHAMLLVGYGTENGQDYWLVKNSWGETWGMGGYIKMARNKGNNCAIASYAVSPKV